MSDTVVIQAGKEIAQLRDVTFYIFDKTSDRALDFCNSFEYPDELDVAVESGHAVRASAEVVFEAYSVLRRSLFVIDSMLHAGEIEAVRYLIADTLSGLNKCEREERESLIIE